MRWPPPVRPAFDVCVPIAPQELLRRAKENLHDSEPKVHAQMAHNHIEILIDEQDRHTWSPWLSVSIKPNNNVSCANEDCLRRSVEEVAHLPKPTCPTQCTASIVHGKYGPHPSVWTMFMSIQLFLAFIALCSVIFGTAQLTLKMAPWAFLGLPLIPLLMFGVYSISLAGQRLGASQMDTLRDSLDDMLEIEHL